MEAFSFLQSTDYITVPFLQDFIRSNKNSILFLCLFLHKFYWLCLIFDNCLPMRNGKFRMFYFFKFIEFLQNLTRTWVLLSTKWLGIMVPVVSAMTEKPLNKKNDRCFPSLKLWVRPPPPAPFEIYITYCFKATCKILRAAYFNNLVKRKEVLKVFWCPVPSWNWRQTCAHPRKLNIKCQNLAEFQRR